MIDSVLNLIFRCRHRRLTRPVAAVTKPGQPHGPSYVVCLDCGKHFSYDLNEMRMGKAIPPPGDPAPSKRKMKMALMAAVPAAAILAWWSGKKKTAGPEPDPHG
jgi:hypothetical protein